MERSIGFLENVSGHTYDMIFDLLFTTERMITLVVRHPSEGPFQIGIMDLLLGGKFSKQRETFDRKESIEERLRTYEEKTFDELLTAHRFNFEIPYTEVAAVEISRGLFQTRLKFHVNSRSKPEYVVYFTLAKNQVPDAQNLLNLALPLKIKNKKKEEDQ